MNKKTLRPAVAMIELIFAIVIMGIILMSAPQLISTANKSGYVAIKQEAINEAASQVNMIMGYHWDKSDANESFIPPILNVLSVSRDTELDALSTTGRRLGTPIESYRTFIRSDGVDGLNASALGSADGSDVIEDDIDDFDGTTSLIDVDPAGNVDYVQDATTININTAVKYISDNSTYNSSDITFSPAFLSTGTTSAATSTNIKRITVTLTNKAGVPEELDKEIILHAFSCNIGGYKLEEKDVN